MYAQITSWENLLLAYRRASRGKRQQAAVATFEYCLEDNLLALQTALQMHTYTPGAYTHFYIHEPKRRLISAAPFRDRVVHHALCNVMEPLFERTFIADSYANRPGKGTHRFQQRYTALQRAYCTGTLPFAHLSSRVQSWVNHVRYGNTIGLRKALLWQPFRKGHDVHR